MYCTLGPVTRTKAQRSRIGGGRMGNRSGIWSVATEEVAGGERSRCGEERERRLGTSVVMRRQGVTCADRWLGPLSEPRFNAWIALPVWVWNWQSERRKRIIYDNAVPGGTPEPALASPSLPLAYVHAHRCHPGAVAYSRSSLRFHFTRTVHVTSP
ncbi:unnamed protein product [Boreogadus saida]